MSALALDPRKPPCDLDRVARNLARTTAELEPIGELARHHGARPGRLCRARVALAAARALGVDRDVAVGLATACERVAEAVAIHEDARTGAPRRRGQATLAHRFGARRAAAFGDYLLMLAIDEVARLDGATPGLVRLFTTTSMQVIRGLEIDVAMDAEGLTPSADAFVANARRREGALLALPIESVLRVAGASDVEQIRARVAMEWAGAAQRALRAPGRARAAGLGPDAADRFCARAAEVADELPPLVAALVEVVLEDLQSTTRRESDDSRAHAGDGAPGPSSLRLLQAG